MTCFARSLMIVDGGSSVRYRLLVILSYKLRMTRPAGKCSWAPIKKADDSCRFLNGIIG